MGRSIGIKCGGEGRGGRKRKILLLLLLLFVFPHLKQDCEILKKADLDTVSSNVVVVVLSRFGEYLVKHVGWGVVVKQP